MHCTSAAVPPMFLFFSMVPEPPRFTLFPYTTLFRSPLKSRWEPSMLLRQHLRGLCIANSCFPVTEGRSEEHTSELQSQSNLVCCLLLEKKNRIRLSRTLANPAATTRRPSEFFPRRSS